MAVQVYFNFNGNCKEAVEYYASVFDTEEPKIMYFGDMPGEPGYPMTDEMKKLVLHAQLTIHDSVVMFSDTLPGMDFVVGNNINLVYDGKTEAEIRTLFHKLAADGTITMELQETFWSKCYGSVVDKFCVNWMLGLASE